MKNEINNEIKRFLETNENEYTAAQNLWDTAKAPLRGKFIATQVYLKKRKEKKRKISSKQPNPTSTEVEKQQQTA